MPADEIPDNGCSAGEKASKIYRLTNQVGYDTELSNGFFDPGRDEGDLPPLASFYRHNNFGREVLLVDTAVDLDLALAVREAEAEVSAAYVACNGGWADDAAEEEREAMEEALLLRERVKLLARYVCERMGFVLPPAAAERDDGGREGNGACGGAGGGEEEMAALTREILADLKLERNSNVVPLGLIRGYGTCRHRALLFKALADRVRPRVPCKLQRGHRGQHPHAWIVVSLREHEFVLELLSRPGMLMHYPSAAAAAYVRLGGEADGGDTHRAKLPLLQRLGAGAPDAKLAHLSDAALEEDITRARRRGQEARALELEGERSKRAEYALTQEAEVSAAQFAGYLFGVTRSGSHA